MKCIVFSARQYAFNDEETKRRVEGVTIQYSDGLSLNEENQRGLFPLSVSAGLDIWHDLRQVPGVYELDFRQRPGKNNRAVLTLAGVKFVAPFPLDGITE